MKKINNYKIYDFYEETYPDDDWDGKFARRKFNELMKIKDERLVEFSKYLNKYNINLDYTENSLQPLNNFICKELKDYMPNLDKKDPYCCEYAEIPYFRSLAIDTTLYIGEMLLKNLNLEVLKWEVYKTTRKETYKHYPSINHSIFAYSIYIYIIQYLGGYNRDKDVIVHIYKDYHNGLKQEFGA
jgi:hypothetical protein